MDMVMGCGGDGSPGAGALQLSCWFCVRHPHQVIGVCHRLCRPVMMTTKAVGVYLRRRSASDATNSAALLCFRSFNTW